MGTRVDVVIIDDDGEIRAVLEEILSEYHYGVRTFEDAERALHYLERHPGVRLIILDMVMRPLSGLQFLGRKAALPPLRDIPVLVCSGYGAFQEWLLPGADRVLLKPFHLHELLDAVQELAPAVSPPS